MADKCDNALSHIGTHERRILHWWACGGVAAFVFVLFAPPLFRGQIPWFMDIVAQFYPVRYHAARLLHAGEMPFWNRTYYLGTPLLANPQWGLLYPGNWLFLAWPNGTTFMLSYPIHIIIGALGCYWLTWELVRGRVAALTAAMFSVCNSWTWAHLAFGAFLNVTAWIPWVAWCVFRFARTGRWSFVALGAVLWALQSLGGAPQMAWYAALNYGLLGVALALLRDEAGRESSSRSLEESCRQFSSRSPDGAALMEPRATPWEEASQEIPKPCKGAPNIAGKEPNGSAAPSGLDNKTSRSLRALPWAILGRPFGASGITQECSKTKAAYWYRIRPLIAVILIGALGAGLAAVQIVPTALFTRECARAGGLHWKEIEVGTLGYRKEFEFNKLTPPTLSQELGANFRSYWDSFFGKTDDAETTACFGVGGLILMLLSLGLLRKQNGLIPIWLLAIADLVFCSHAIGPYLYRHFPTYGSFHDPKRILGVAQALLCVLVGGGCQYLSLVLSGAIPLRGKQSQNAKKRWLEFLAFLPVLCILLWNPVNSIPLKVYHLPLFMAWQHLDQVDANLRIFCYGMAVICIVMALSALRRKKDRTQAALGVAMGGFGMAVAGCVCATQCLVFTANHIDCKTAAIPELSTYTAERLKQTIACAAEQRFVALDATGNYSYDYSMDHFGGLVLPNLASLYGLEDVQGYDPFIPKPYIEWLNGINGTEQRRFRRHFGLVNPDAAFRTLPAPWGAIVCQRELLGAAEKQLGIKLDGKVTNVWPDGRIVVYEPAEVAPYIALEEGAGAFVEMRGLNPNDSTQRTQRAQSGTEVKIVRKTANSLAVTVPPSAQTRTLKIADILLPGWTAAIDGKRAAFGDGPLMRLAIPPSEKEQRVELRYWPPGLSTGAAVSVLSLAVMAFICVASRRSRRWRPEPAPRATPE